MYTEVLNTVPGKTGAQQQIALVDNCMMCQASPYCNGVLPPPGH